jgi:hypothetical protein
MALGEEPGVGTVMICGPQYRKLMRTYQEAGTNTASARKAGMDRKTASKYIGGAPGPEEKRPPRQWRTRVDPFEGAWKEVEGWLSAKARPGSDERAGGAVEAVSGAI